MNVTERLDSLGLVLPDVPAPGGAYVPARRAGPRVFTAGQPGDRRPVGACERDLDAVTREWFGAAGRVDVA